jgi:UDP-N-acetylmuramoylalanine--D-glutamate ligase
MLDVTDKKITVMGLGVLGRGVNVCKYLLEKGVDKLIITDLKSADQLQPSIEQLNKHINKIEYVLGRHRIQDFTQTDVVVKAAGVPKDSKYIQAAKTAGVPIKMDSSWFATMLPEGVTIIGVTGTKGKSSVSHLIKHIIETAGKKVFLGGNILGQATLPLLDQVQSGDLIVLELDSWQLQGWHDEKISPDIAVFTNFMSDHLNYYQSMPEYFSDKLAIYAYQGTSDHLVLSVSSYEALEKYSDTKPYAKTAIVKPSILMKDWHYTQPGEHNRLNAAMAYQVAKFLNINDDNIKQALGDFAGVSGRLERIDEVGDIDFYNDTNATTPDATAQSIKAIANKHEKIIIICGGVSKGFTSFEVLIESINQYTSGAVLLPGGVANSIESDLEVPIYQADSMSTAVKTAVDLARANNSKSVLMSPAGSSFGLFKNEYDRGDQFVAAVRNL